MKKILPIAQPQITALPSYASALAILLQTENGRNWYLQQFLHTIHVYNLDENGIASEFINVDLVDFASKYCMEPYNIHAPGLEISAVPKSLIKGSYFDFVIEAIDNDYYVHAYVERAKIKQHDGQTWTHEIFIYGYDKSTKEVFITDYFRNGRLKNTTCSFEEIINALNCAENFFDLNDGVCVEKEDYSKIFLAKYNSNFRYVFSLEKLLEDFDNYLNKNPILSYDSKIHNNPTVALKAFDSGYEILEKYIRNDRSGRLDVRQFCIMLDHKIALKEKIEFLIKEYELNFGYEQEINKIINLSRILVNLSLKYSQPIKNKEKDIVRMYPLLDELKNREYQLLASIVKVFL